MARVLYVQFLAAKVELKHSETYQICPSSLDWKITVLFKRVY